MTKFRELETGDTFDWVGPVYRFNTYFVRCVKTGKRTYSPIEGEAYDMRVGTTTAEVYHVEHKSKG